MAMFLYWWPRNGPKNARFVRRLLSLLFLRQIIARQIKFNIEQFPQPNRRNALNYSWNTVITLRSSASQLRWQRSCRLERIWIRYTSSNMKMCCSRSVEAESVDTTNGINKTVQEAVKPNYSLKRHQIVSCVAPTWWTTCGNLQHKENFRSNNRIFVAWNLIIPKFPANYFCRTTYLFSAVAGSGRVAVPCAGALRNSINF